MGEQREYVYRVPWLMIALPLGFGAWVLGDGAFGWWMEGLQPVQAEPWARICYGGVLTLGGLVVVLVGILAAVKRLRNPATVVLTESALLVPRSPWSGDRVTVPYVEITEVAVINELGLLGGCVIRILRGTRACRIGWPMASRADVEEIARLLAQRLEPRGVPLTRYSTRYGIRWSRPQFSLRAMLLAMTCVAASLSLFCSLERDLQTALQGIPILVVLMLIPYLLVFSGWRPAVLAGLGFVAGLIVEWTAMFARLAAPSPAMGGWYPFTCAFQQVIADLGWADPIAAMGYGIFPGLILSGLAGSILFLAIFWAARSLLAIVRRPSSSQRDLP